MKRNNFLYRIVKKKLCISVCLVSLINIQSQIWIPFTYGTGHFFPLFTHISGQPTYETHTHMYRISYYQTIPIRKSNGICTLLAYVPHKSLFPDERIWKNDGIWFLKWSWRRHSLQLCYKRMPERKCRFSFFFFCGIIRPPMQRN